MHLDFAKERIVAVVAHPDDAELLCAGTLCRAREDGASVAVCVLCKGDRGQPDVPIANLSAVRRQEMSTAMKLVGAKLFSMGCGDGALADNAFLRQRLVEVLRRFRATLVLAHDPLDYHPDHQAASRLTPAATWFCASKGRATRSPALPASPALWFMDTVEMTGFSPGFYVDVSAHMNIKREMLRCHQSQLIRGKDTPALQDLLERQSRARGAQADVEHAEAFRLAPLMKRMQAW